MIRILLTQGGYTCANLTFVRVTKNKVHYYLIEDGVDHVDEISKNRDSFMQDIIYKYVSSDVFADIPDILNAIEYNDEETLMYHKLKYA